MADEIASLLLDGQTNFLGGQDASKIPSRVPNDSYFAGVNISVTKGVPSPRWGFTKRDIVFPEGGVTNPISNVTVPYEEIFHGGRFQCAFTYQIGIENFIIIVVSGVIFLISLSTLIAQVLEVDGGGLNENAPRLNWSTAGNFNVIFDYPNFPVILDGNTARRADPAKAEVPVSVLGAYNQNRLFIANNGNDFTGGDPAGSLAAPEAPVTFLEVETVGSPFFGQIFQLPTGIADGPITAMGFIDFVDTSTGIGPLFVATANKIFTFQTQIPRSQWENGQFGSSFISTSGIVGPRAFINVNSDLFFLSSDYQVRTASMSRDEQKKWSKVPISREVEDWLYTHDQTLGPYAVMGYFQNKIFVATNPFRVSAENTQRQEILDVAHGGFVVLELDNLATLGKDGTPAWAGLWTGVRPMEIFNTNLGQRCFIISKDEGSRNELYEVMPDQTFDEADNIVRQVDSIIYTREFDFQDPFQLKALHSIDLGVRNAEGDFKIDVLYKPMQGISYVKWGDFSNIAPWRTCEVPQGCFVNGFAPHQFRDQTIGFPVANNVCDLVGKTVYNILKKVQLKIQVTGIFWQLEEFRLKAKKLDQSQQVTLCNKYSDAPLCQPCSNDWAIPPFKGCPPPAPIDPCAPLDLGGRICNTCE